MKKHLLFCKATFITFLLFSSLGVFPQFRQIHLDPDEDISIKKVDFYSDAEGYIASYRSLGFSTDSGKTIIDKPISFSNVDFNGYNVNLTFGFQLSGVKAFDKNKLLVYGNYGLVPAILYSNDAAKTFKVVFHSQFSQVPDAYIADVAFEPNNKVGFALERHRILKTVDGGNTWTVCLTQENRFSKLKVFNESTIYACKEGQVQSKFSSVDGGNTWEYLFYSYTGGVNEATACQVFFSEQKIWLNTTSGKLLTSEDGGKSWLLQNDPKNSPVVFSAMSVINDSTAYAIPEVGFDVYKTTNKGKVWEKLHRDNNFSYLSYGLEDIQILNSNIWVGGGHGYLALSNNLGGTTVPSALFSVTETVSEATSSVKITLKNYGRGGYNYEWYVNGKKISDSFDASYTADLYGYNDTISLIANNSLYTDTLTKVTNFSRAVKVASFSPLTAATGQTVTINGSNFNNVTEVSFGGVPAKFSYSYGSLVATVGKGESGDIKVSTAKSTSSKPGFVYIPPPKILSYTPESAKIGDTVIIKGQRLDKIDKVWFNGTETTFKKVSENELKAVVPYSRSINGNIVIKSFSGADTIGGFKVQPRITSLSVTKGQYNSTLYVYGSGFYDVESITFDGHPVLSFKYEISMYNIPETGSFLNIQLGEGGEQGELLIKLKNGLSVKYSGFEYYQTPRIDALVPSLAKPGEQIKINGNNFREKPEENFVYFGAVRATVNSATKTSLTVTVPTGATYSPVTVVNALTTSTSVKYFTPVFENSFKINPNTFTSLNYGRTGINSNALSICDFSGDGKPDISITNYGSAGDLNYFITNDNTPGTIDIKLGKALLYHNVTNAVHGSIYSTVADWNYDGILDVVYAGVLLNGSGSEEYASYFKFDYAEKYIREKTSLSYRASFYNSFTRFVPTGIVANDMNADGQIDILMSGNYGSNYFPNICLGDLDGDGKADVLVKKADSLLIYRNTSSKDNISYAPKISYYVGAAIQKLIVADFDNDDKLDIALTTSSSSGVQIWKNISNGANISITKSLSLPINETPTSIAVADINGDGKVDLAIGHDKGKVLIYQNNTDKDIDFMSPVSVDISARNDLALADIDGDTRPDIIGLTDNSGDKGLQIMRNTVGTSKISSFYPTGGAAGTTIEIKGENFSKTQTLSIGGTSVASFQIKSDTTISAVVGEGNYGFISLETDNGAGSSASNFNFLSKPQIIAQGILSEAYTIQPGDSALLSMYNYKLGAFEDPLLKIQWFKNGEIIQNATKSVYTAKESGNYTVQTSYGNSVSEMSNNYNLRVLLQLDYANFQISVNNIGCKGYNTGSININAKENLDYTVSLTGPINKTQSFTSEAMLTGLSAGNYKIRITVKNQPDFEQLYEVNITEPNEFVVLSTVNPQEKTVSFRLDGSDLYHISINGKVYNVSGDTKLPLDEEINKISISTDKICQGIFHETVNLGDYPIIYPNPVKDILRINMANFEANTVNYKIMALNGTIVYTDIKHLGSSKIIETDLINIPKGIYLLSLICNQHESVYKIIKE